MITKIRHIPYVYALPFNLHTLHTRTDNLVPVFTYACIARRSDGRHVLALKLSDKCKVLFPITFTYR